MDDVRVYRIMGGLALAGVAGCATLAGTAAALGFAAGSFISFLNFRWMSRLSHLEKPVTPRLGMLLGGRYLLFGVAGYAIFKYSEIGFLAALAGCFVHVTAVFIEAVYDLIYAGTP